MEICRVTKNKLWWLMSRISSFSIWKWFIFLEFHCLQWKKLCLIIILGTELLNFVWNVTRNVWFAATISCIKIANMYQNQMICCIFVKNLCPNSLVDKDMLFFKLTINDTCRILFYVRATVCLLLRNDRICWTKMVWS